MKYRCVLALMAGTVFASSASAQTAFFYNGSFEALCPFCGGPFPDGWHSPGGDTIANRRFVGDGEVPAFSAVGTPGALTPHCGDAVAGIGTHGAGGFEGLTTDSVNFCYCDQSCQTQCDGPFPFFDPFFDINAGSVVVFGYYMIPANDAITDQAGIKINVKLANQDVATIENLSITGHTDGQWTLFTVVFPREEIQAQYDCNRGVLPECGCNCVPMEPAPDHTKITLLRFVGDGEPSSGTIYWDDIVYFQLAADSPCDPLDFNNDGVFPDTTDLFDFLNVFSGGSCECPFICNDIDFNNDEVFPDFTDLDGFIVNFSGGPCQ